MAFARLRCSIFVIAIANFCSAAATSLEDAARTLGVSRLATEAEINAAFRPLAFRYHPDRNPDDPQAEAKLKEINIARDTLLGKRPQGDSDMPPSSSGEADVRARRATRGQSPGEETMECIRNTSSIKVEILTAAGVICLRKALKKAEGDAINAAVYEYELANIWGNIGFSVNFNAGRVEVTEAAFRAAFIVLYDLEMLAPSRFRSLNHYGIEQILDKLRFHGKSAGPSHPKMTMLNRALAFAMQGEGKSWSPDASCATLLSGGTDGRLE